MFPNWGNFGAPQPNNFGGAGPRKQLAGNQNAGFGFEAATPSSGSLFSSLQEQHMQQMQQLQMLHQKQLQSVLHHGNNTSAYGGGHSGGYPGPAWHAEGAGHQDSGARPQSFYGQEPQARGVPPAPKPGYQPPPPPSQPTEPQPVPPPPEPHAAKPPDSGGPPKAKQATEEQATTEDDNSVPLQEQQQLWYKKHLQNLQKLKQEKAKQNQRESDGPALPPPLSQTGAPPPPKEPPKSTPPPPPPKEEPPAPPPPPLEIKPEIPKDQEEAARLQQLQAAAAQWQQVQQQRVGMQYQALMQQHEKLQQVLEKYQQVIQQPTNLQSMTAEMQLRHHEMQQQQFTPLFQEWDRSFALWYEQFQTYPHKDQLHDYEHQWKQWQEQMNATNAHLQERIATLSAMVPFAIGQYNSGMMGQFNQYPGQDMQMQQQSVNTGIQQSPAAGGPASQGGLVRGSGPTGVGVRPLGPQGVTPTSFNSARGPNGTNPRFDQPHQGFDGPPRFDQPQQRFDGPPRFDQPRHRFDGPPRFDQPKRFDGPPRFDQPQHRFDGPPRFDQPRQRFDGPPRFDQPRHRFDGPPRFDQQRQRFDCPPRFDQPRFGQQPRFEAPRHPGPPPRAECPPVSQQTPKPEPTVQKPSTVDTKKPELSASQRQSEKQKCDTDNKSDKTTPDEDMTDDNLLGTDGFFVPNDPIPQTVTKNVLSKDVENTTSDGSDKPTAVNSDPSVPTTSATVSQNTVKNALKQDEPKIPHNIPKSLEVESPSAGNLQLRPEPPLPPTGRGRGQPPMPVQMRGRGRGQKGSGEFRGPSTGPLGEEEEEMSYDYVQPEESEGMPEEQENYDYEEPFYDEFGGEDSEIPREDIWMPDEHYPEEEYYEGPMGGPHMGRGRPPMMRGGPPMGRGGPPMGRGGPPMGRGGFPMGRGGPPFGRGGPPVGRGGPPMGRGGPPMGRGGPPIGRGGPPMGRGGPPMGRGGPPMGRGGPPMGRGGPPMGRGGPPMGRGGPPMERGEPFDEQWEEHELAEYPEEGDPYWSERRPPMRGMRPPFPPGWGRPPRGHPAFMHPGRGRPLHPPHGPMDDEPLDYEADADDPSVDSAGPPMYDGHDPHIHPMHPEAGRGRRRMLPPPPREMMEEAYHDEMREQELGWQPPHGRGAPLPPHEIIDRGGMRRRPMGRGMARGMWHHGPDREEYKEDTETYVEDYNHGEGGHRWRAPPDYPPEEHPRDAKYHEYRERSPHERGYAPRMLPPEAFRDSHWEEERERERERGHPYRYDEHERGKGELRIHEYRDGSPYRREEPPYPPPPDWERRPRPFSPPERGYPSDYPDRPRYDDLREDPPLDRPAAPPAVTSLPESSAESQGMSGNLLALSQRQHEIILKAAQELKLIRELQEAKTPGTEPQQPAPADNLPELPAGLLGLEIPPEVRNVLKGMTVTSQTTATEAATHYQPAAPPVIPKTVDYGHGHEPGTTVERISYGERIVLRPDPVTTDRGYEKELLGPRDPYSRDPYYDRRSDPYMDRRDYARERESYREKPDYERERFERERYPPRERDDSTQAMVEERSPLAHPLRSAYRERDRDVREKERSGSRDPEDHYGRLPYDRSSYERTGLDRSGPDRYGHSSSPYERRSNPESRGPSAAPPLQPPPQPPPRIEKKPEIKNIDDILKTPGRLSRPERIVIIMRGLPGSGKSHVAKLIRDKEVDCGGAPPRVLVLDDYFMTEVEKTEKDPDTGKRVKKKVLEYEYEPEMEDTYRNSMLKTFKKTLDDGFFPFIILDTINDKVKHFDQFWSAAKTKGFEVYLAEITADTQTCAKRNVHGRTVKDITKMSNNWEPSPRHMVRLDVRSLLQDAAIEEVEMEDFNPEDEPQEPKREEEEEGDMGYIPKSKWEMDTSEAKLDKLDGLSGGGKRKRDGEDMAGLEDYLQLPDDYATRMSQPGKKRVRWADLEEQKDADRKRAIGFVVGQTDWERITDESGQLAQKALNRTKYF
ncbi:YLP motif-containing protein 1 isoform X2 [Salarias fasciatus]|uniref:YLP motif-containing protein 1 isoform X2 n=1 Tax=Salarias fasciatus TaxID=181472 RepID=UPI0011766FDC|nr:YLP motif-containing protein 1 isoform X2 [Salarias fasciatus]